MLMVKDVVAARCSSHGDLAMAIPGKFLMEEIGGVFEILGKLEKNKQRRERVHHRGLMTCTI